MAQSRTTTDHEEIRAWAEARGGRPSRVRGTEDDGGGGLLRLDFGDQEEGFDPIDWNTFFKVFEDNQLALILQDETASGATSRFSKFVRREG